MGVMSRIPAPVRFLGIVVVLVAIFGACGSLMLSAMDLAQQQETANLFDPGVLFSHTLHFLQQAWGVLTVYTDQTGVPLHDYFIRGVGLTIEFCFISMPLALLLGFVLALMSGTRSLAPRPRTRICRVLSQYAVVGADAGDLFQSGVLAGVAGQCVHRRRSYSGAQLRGVRM